MNFIKLGDISSIATGPFGSQLHQSDYSDVGIPVVMPKDLLNGCILEDGIARVSEDHVQRLKRHMLHTGNIVFARRGDVGRCAYVSNKEDGWLCGTGCFKVEIDTNKAHPKYVFFQCQDSGIVEWIKNRAIGATLPNLNTSIISKVPIFLPPLITQQKIASILSAYDSQIENNKKRIKLLEQMAENLYKEWFVRFRFPGYENAEFEGGVPKGWQRKNLTDIMIFQKGVEPGSDAYTEDKTLTPFFRVGDIEDKEPTYYVDINTLQKYQLVQPMDVLCSFDGTVGRVAIGLEGLYSSGMCKISPNNKNISPAYVYYLMKSQPVQNTIQTFANGSTILHAGKSIKKLQTYFETSVVKEYGEIATPILNEILSLEKENKQLTHQRDLLLPRLMSGKLSI